MAQTGAARPSGRFGIGGLGIGGSTPTLTPICISELLFYYVKCILLYRTNEIAVNRGRRNGEHHGAHR
jgi:hypothetical protein